MTRNLSVCNSERVKEICTGFVGTQIVSVG